MTPVIQDVVLLMIPTERPSKISWRGGNMVLNRFCIDEEMANESSGVFYPKKGKESNFIQHSLITSADQHLMRSSV